MYLFRMKSTIFRGVESRLFHLKRLKRLKHLKRRKNVKQNVKNTFYLDVFQFLLYILMFLRRNLSSHGELFMLAPSRSRRFHSLRTLKKLKNSRKARFSRFDSRFLVRFKRFKVTVPRFSVVLFILKR